MPSFSVYFGRIIATLNRVRDRVGTAIPSELQRKERAHCGICLALDAGSPERHAEDGYFVPGLSSSRKEQGKFEERPSIPASLIFGLLCLKLGLHTGPFLIPEGSQSSLCLGSAFEMEKEGGISYRPLRTEE